MQNRVACAVTIVHIHVRDVVVNRMASDEDKGNPARPDCINYSIVCEGGSDNDPINHACRNDMLNRAPLVFRLGEPQHGRIIVLITRSRNPLNYLWKIRISEK